MKKTFKLIGLDCANCAAQIENAIQKIDGVKNASVSFMTGKLVIEVFDYGEMEFVRKNFKRTDLFVIISLSGETKEGIRILNAVIPTGVRLLSITRLQSNTISGLCDYNLYVATQVVEQQSFYELISAFYILLDLLFLNYLEYVTEVENYEL